MVETTIPTLLEGIILRRDSILEIGRTIVGLSHGRDPLSGIDISGIPPVRVGPIHPERERIRQLLTVTDGQEEDFDAGGGELYIPPTASAIWLMPVFGRVLRRLEVKLPAARTLHLGNEVRFDRTPTTRTDLHVEGRVASLDITPERIILTLRGSFLDASGAPQFTVDTTVFFPGERREQQRTRKERERVPYGAREIHRFRPTIGASRAYGIVSGDLNLVHISALAARASGFPTAFIHGYNTKARIAHRIVHTLLQGDPTRLRRLTVRFRRPIFMGEDVGIFVGPEESTPEGTHQDIAVGPGPGETARVIGEVVFG